jgi:hypothetical protein
MKYRFRINNSQKGKYLPRINGLVENVEVLDKNEIYITTIDITQNQLQMIQKIFFGITDRSKRFEEIK